MDRMHIASYICSDAYNHIIISALKDNDVMALHPISDNNFFLLKHVKSNINSFSDVDKLIIDLSALKDMDEEIIEALDTIRFMSDLELIILATNRMVGDPLLKQIFQMGIYNLVCSSDYQEILDGLNKCLTTGMSYKDAVQYKTEASERVIVKTEIRKAVNKVMIGIACAQERVGGTYSAIHLAVALRKRGYIVACVECNEKHPVFQLLADEYEEKLIGDHYTIEGVDFYVKGSLDSAMAKTSYNFIVCDFGSYAECDTVTFNKCHVRLVLSGSCAWDIDNLNNSVFKAYDADLEALRGFKYLFINADPTRRKDIKKSMEPLESYFVEYEPDLFQPEAFPDIDVILSEYLLEQQTEKKGFWRKRKKR